MSDEIYSRLLYEGREHVTLLDYPAIRDRVIVLDGWSKTYAMTGWRIGYGVWPAELAPQATRLAINCNSCVNAPTQHAALAALTGPQDSVETMRRTFDERRKLIVAALNRVDGVTCVDSAGAFYAMPNITGTGLGAGTMQGGLLEEACAAAVGECVERYSCASYAWDELVYASQRELGSAAVGMDEIQLYSIAQYEHPAFPFAPWRDDVRIHWSEGESLLSGRSRCIPAALVYIPYRPYRPRRRDRPSDFVGLSVSSGQACAGNRARAVLSGLYEVVERDAFMIRWVRRLPPARIEFLESPTLAAIYDQYFAGCNLRFDVFDLTLDIAIPTVLGVARSRTGRGPILAVGAASDLSEEKAIAKALKESYQSIIWARELLAQRPNWRPAPDYANVRDFEDHVRLYAEPDMASHLDFILHGTDRRAPRSARTVRTARTFDDVDEELRCALAAVDRVGLDAVVVDTTSPEIAELGLHCPKVFLPGAVQLTAAHGMPAYGAARLYDVPGKLGFKAPIHREFNPVPHPFP
jgi:ribosomal protein S12 methylthiotransferase accessory factor